MSLFSRLWQKKCIFETWETSPRCVAFSFKWLAVQQLKMHLRRDKDVRFARKKKKIVI